MHCWITDQRATEAEVVSFRHHNPRLGSEQLKTYTFRVATTYLMAADSIDIQTAHAVSHASPIISVDRSDWPEPPPALAARAYAADSVSPDK